MRAYRFENSLNAFTLIELMIVVAIIGILASTAIPAFQQYIINAKYAEGYVGVGAIQRAQIMHYNEHGHFVNGAGLTSSTPIPIGGKKYVLDSNLVSNSTPFGWNRLGQPIPDGSLGLFSYASYAGGWDSSGQAYMSIYDEDGYSPTTGGGGYFDSIGTSKKFMFTGNAHCGNTFGDAWDATSFGIQEVPNEAYAAVFAGIKFTSTNSEACSLVFQVIRGYSGKATASPIITINKGE